MKSGSVIIVGTGIRLAQQCTPEAIDAIKSADIVFCVLGNPIAQQWLQNLNANLRSLQELYARDLERPKIYAAMADEIVAAVLEGKDVCVVFYGHPGVFVTPSHAVLRRVRAAGLSARMLPAISAEDCLFADLGVDPGAIGCQSYEAADFFVHAPTFDPFAALVLWQIAIVGDLGFKTFEADPRHLKLLRDVLAEHYPLTHAVTIYEAATLPGLAARIETMPLERLHHAALSQQSTLYVAPAGAPLPSPARLAALAAVSD